jgi:hypothetical protein
MSTPFSFETVFRAPSAEAVLAAYFDPDLLAAQDALGELTDRKVVEDTDNETQRKTSWTVRSIRQLPVFVRPFVEGGRLSYVETMTWRKRDSEIDLTVVPQIAGGRVSITAAYNLTQIAEGQVRRRYSGDIKVDVKLISGKIERAILSEIEKGMPMMRDCTQSWLSKKYGTHT